MVMSPDSKFSNGDAIFGAPYAIDACSEAPNVLLVCEHASNQIPAALNNLGLSDAALLSHVAWDPGALGVAQSLNRKLGAILFSGTVSRLVYDCNRSPDAASAIPSRSEVFDIPGNTGLNDADRQRRIEGVFAPFSNALADQITQHRTTLELMVTVHSFTPVFHGAERDVEIGILHGTDGRFASAMMKTAPTDHEIRLNEPYTASDGVAHTLDMHGAANELPSVMIEIRNDLIATEAEQDAMGGYLAPWIRTAMEKLEGGQ